MTSFAAKPLVAAPSSTELVMPGALPNEATTLDSPSLLLMTDLRQMPAIKILDTTQIDDALGRMVFAGVRMLFVVDGAGALLGLVTSYDIAGEKPMKLLHERDSGLTRHGRAGILVRDIMQPLTNWHVLEYSVVEHARIGDIVETFKRSGQHHLMVLEKGTDGHRTFVRGLFSSTQFERVLGMRIEISSRPNTFADVERLLAHPH